MYDAVSEVQAVVLANEGKCNTFRQQYSRFEYLWKKDLTASLQVRPANAFGSCATLHMQQSCCSCCQPAELLSQHVAGLAHADCQVTSKQAYLSPSCMLPIVQAVLLPQCAEEQAGLLQEFLNAEGKQAEDGNKEDPALDRFEAEIAKYKAVQDEIQV